MAQGEEILFINDVSGVAGPKPKKKPSKKVATRKASGVEICEKNSGKRCWSLDFDSGNVSILRNIREVSWVESFTVFWVRIFVNIFGFI